MTSPNQNTPKLRGHVVVTIACGDLLAVNNIQLRAVSASSAHGGPLYDSHYMVSWIEAASIGQNDHR